MSSKINFIKLTKHELSSKVALLVLNKLRIIFWKDSPRYLEGNAISFYENKLILKTRDLSLLLKGSFVCLNFTLNEIDYFMKGKVISQIEIKEELEIELLEECFRVEKRDYERVQLFPQYEVYVYLKYNGIKSENIFFINKNDQKKNDLFLNIKNQEKQKLALASPDLETNEEQELVGFRVEDLSSNGLCFLASTKENEQILTSLINTKFELILIFGTHTYLLREVQIIYQINYLTQQFAGIPMYKIGITFNENIEIQRKIQELTGRDDKILNYQEEFEEFIKNE